MNTRESLITLSIREAEAPPRAFLYHLRVDAEVVAANQQLSPEDSQAVRDFSRRFSALFEQRFTPQIAADNLNALGSRLFNLWLAPAWEKVTDKVPPGAHRLLVIASNVPDRSESSLGTPSPTRRRLHRLRPQVHHPPLPLARPHPAALPYTQFSPRASARGTPNRLPHG
mgnify:CR=1 FL=1